MNLDFLLKTITKTARDMWDRGWAEANGGNISLRLNAEQVEAVGHFSPKGDWIGLPESIPALSGERFLVTGTGSFLRNIELVPERNLGFIELDGAGKNYRIIWGYEPAGSPTSELPAHLLSHAAIKEVTNNRDHSVIHTHAPNLIALTYAIDNLSTASLSHLLWKMHAECVVVFPQGVRFIPWMMAGSLELGIKTAESLSRCPLAVWEHHGIVGTGRNLDEAFGRIYVAEKAAEIYIKTMAAGGIKKCLSDEQIYRIAKNFNCDIDTTFLEIEVDSTI